MYGRLKEVKDAIEMLVEEMHNYSIECAKKGKTLYAIKILIPEQFVAKIIGVGILHGNIRWEYHKGNIFRVRRSSSESAE